MRKPRTDGQATRQALLKAASEVFALKGFREATIAEICHRAAANLSAANYYFGSKEALYVESWRFALHSSLQLYPPDGGVPPDAPVEERLHGCILAIMQRIVDPQSHELDIVYKELANPTGLLGEALQESLEPIFTLFLNIVRELLGRAADEQQVRLCLMSIRAQCFGPLIHERRRKQDPCGLPSAGPEPFMEDVQRLADHITRFSLAGIERVGHPDLKQGG